MTNKCRTILIHILYSFYLDAGLLFKELKPLHVFITYNRMIHLHTASKLHHHLYQLLGVAMRLEQRITANKLICRCVCRRTVPTGNGQPNECATNYYDLMPSYENCNQINIDSNCTVLRRVPL